MFASRGAEAWNPTLHEQTSYTPDRCFPLNVPADGDACAGGWGETASSAYSKAGDLSPSLVSLPGPPPDQQPACCNALKWLVNAHVLVKTPECSRVQVAHVLVKTPACFVRCSEASNVQLPAADAIIHCLCSEGWLSRAPSTVCDKKCSPARKRGTARGECTKGYL